MAVRAAAWIVLLALVLPAFGGQISYAARGNFDPDEGTLEVWFTPLADLYPVLDEGQYQSVFTLFSLTVPDAFSCNCAWYGRGAHHALHISMSHVAGRDLLIPLPAPVRDWQSAVRHHLAFTWRGPIMRLYGNGVLIGRRDQAAAFSGPLGHARLIIGHQRDQHTPLIIHAVRLSNIARAGDLLDGQPTLDIYTLLLDRFDTPEAAESLASRDAGRGEPRTSPLLDSAVSDSGGILSGAHRFVTLPTSGLSLAPE